MARRIARDPIYSGRRFSAETIETCVRWYITCRLSYRDLVAIMRWVLRYVPEYERRWARFARSPGSSWRMDETAVSVRGGRHYLYRAVDRRGKSIASLLCNDRSMASAQAFFFAAVNQEAVPWPEKINLDGNSATHCGLRLLGEEDGRWRDVAVRARHYLNNVVEQDHRAIKQRCAPMWGLKTFRSAAIALASIELAHRIRKQQYSLPTGVGGRACSLKDSRAVALVDSSVPTSRCDDRHSPTHQIWRYWHYHYRYGGKRRTLSLGTYPDVSTSSAQLRHRAARRLLSAGIDPSLRRRELRRIESGGLEAESPVSVNWLRVG